MNDLFFNISTIADFDLSALTPEALAVNLSALYQEAAHPLDEMIIQCSFTKRPGCEKYFRPVITKHGVCYTFNSQEQIDEYDLLYKTTRSGTEFALDLLFNIQQDEYYLTLGGHSAGMRVMPLILS